MSTKTLCRLCGKNTKEYIDIFKENGLKKCLGIKAASCLQIFVSPRDGLPKTMCKPCCAKLDESYDFFERSSKVQLFLSILYRCNNETSSTVGVEHTKQESEKWLPASQNLPENQLENIPLNASYEGQERDKATPLFENKNNTKITLNSGISYVPPGTKMSEILQGYPWSCTICKDGTLDSVQDLRNHYKTKHDRKPTFQCIHCTKEYHCYSTFTRHYKQQKAPERYECNECGKKFNQKSILSAHTAVHVTEKLFTCETCYKLFKTSRSLASHKKLHREIKETFKCPLCQKIFSSKRSVEIHQKSHTGERNYMCDVCGKAFTTKSSLIYHLLSHTDQKNFSCAICGHSFKTAKCLRKHSHLHSNIKPHRCDICEKTFQYRSSLVAHRRIHTGELPYNCKVCNKEFRFFNTLKVHNRVHTGEKPYSCKQCSRTFANWPNYNKHVKRIHKTETSTNENNQRELAEDLEASKAI